MVAGMVAGEVAEMVFGKPRDIWESVFGACDCNEQHALPHGRIKMMHGGIIKRLTVSGGFGTVRTHSHMCERFPIQKILLLLLIILLSCMILGALESTSEEMYSYSYSDSDSY